ncbi:MAG TPA: ABC transporter permease [Methanospirillum sp.]|nr:ABC transporter permease [Methanospirillum sp.]
MTNIYNGRIPILLTGAYRIWARNMLVFCKNIRVNSLPPFVEPLLYLGAIGFGIGTYVGEVDGIPFVRFIAPAILAASVMNASFFECAYGTYVRMYYQKAFDAIMATPLTIREIIIGEILWGATRGLISSAAILLVLSILGLADLPSSLLVLPLSFLAGFLFAAIAACFSSVTPSIDALSYPSLLYIAPMFLFSGTFFPLALLPEPLQIFAFIALPLTHVVALTRGIMVGTAIPFWPIHLIWIIGGIIIATALAVRLYEQRLIV